MQRLHLEPFSAANTNLHPSQFWHQITRYTTSFHVPLCRVICILPLNEITRNHVAIRKTGKLTY